MSDTNGRKQCGLAKTGYYNIVISRAFSQSILLYRKNTFFLQKVPYREDCSLGLTTRLLRQTIGISIALVDQNMFWMTRLLNPNSRRNVSFSSCVFAKMMFCTPGLYTYGFVHRVALLTSSQLTKSDFLGEVQSSSGDLQKKNTVNTSTVACFSPRLLVQIYQTSLLLFVVVETTFTRLRRTSKRKAKMKTLEGKTLSLRNNGENPT